MCSLRKKKKGFTLVEVMIYLGITMLLLALPTSFVLIKNKIYDFKVQKEINEVHSFFIECKQISRNRRKEGVILFDLLNNRISYGNTHDSLEIRLKSLKISNNLNNKILINGNGKIATSGTIWLRNKEKEGARITIEPSTGKINLYDL
ncbi:prepilin-type N-terminal cleavage/methylation domain-containing protein [Clostridium sp.]|uniref:pilus assembly FimT family protein n=1 Tax=Clostridium sp. TaxID=1506 RepID=UPI00261EA856|nr:prepilin-type N-terminal cleavage/methylation domain-containing protein [Clostridium sp.]